MSTIAKGNSFWSPKRSRNCFWSKPAALVLLCLLGSQNALAGIAQARIAELQGRATAEGSVRLIVRLDLPKQRIAKLGTGAANQRRAEIAAAQQAFAASSRQAGIDEIHRFRYIPFAVYRADATGVQRLGRHPRVLGLQEDIPESPVLESSAQVIGAPAAWMRGFDGTEQVVVILDTGVETSHPFFSSPGKIAAEACFSSNDGDDVVSLCPEESEIAIGPGSGINCEIANCAHGTHVAGIAAGYDGVGPDIGIGRGAGLVSIQVYSRFNSTPGCQNPCALSFPSDQIEALEHVLELHETLPIAAVNMSLGGSAYTDQDQCDEEQASRKEAIDNLRAAGIATIIASGNAQQRNAIYTPACISSAISVSATTDEDAISSFSNVASFLDLLAPGSVIDSSVPGGGVASMSGTSMAAPHVAGAWAVLRHGAPEATVDEILAALRDTGTVVDDQRSGGSVTGMRRINLDQALEVFVPLITDQVFIDGFELE